MDSVFNQILEIEKRADEIVSKANKEAAEINARISDTGQYAKPYYDKAAEHIKDIEQKALAKKQQKLSEIEAGAQKDKERLERAYIENGDKWVDTLYSMITESGKK